MYRRTVLEAGFDFVCAGRLLYRVVSCHLPQSCFTQFRFIVSKRYTSVEMESCRAWSARGVDRFERRRSRLFVTVPITYIHTWLLAAMVGMSVSMWDEGELSLAKPRLVYSKETISS
jgi:hypothetical protein